MKIILALLIVLALNTMLFLSQTAVSELATDYNKETPTIYDYDESMIKNFNTGNKTNPVLTDDVEGGLPTSRGQVETDDTGNVFTDTFLTVKEWFLDTTGLNYLYGFVTAIPTFLDNLGLPAAVSFALGFFWWVLTLFLIIAFIKGNY